jgi:hypothetical protein
MALSKIVLGLLLVSVALGAYNTSRAHKLINACAATLATEAEINSWTCKYCSEYKLINVNGCGFRPKPLTTPFWTSTDTLDSHQTTTP